MRIIYNSNKTSIKGIKNANRSYYVYLRPNINKKVYQIPNLKFALLIILSEVD
jgi:hypothetical protein